MSVLVLEAITPWVMELARQLSAHVPVTALQHVTAKHAKNLNLARQSQEGALNIRTRTFPPGFARSFATIFTPNIARGIAAEIGKLEAESGQTPHIITPYPYSAIWLRKLPNARIVYYNLDDYEQYDGDTARARMLEGELLQRAEITVCLSIHQVERFRKRFPHIAERIHHVPLGITESYLNPAPENAPRPNVVGYVGNLSDRVDWKFVDDVVQETPELSFEFVGHAGDDSAPWAQIRAQVFARENVRFLGPIPQAEVAPYYWDSAVNWMPYDIAHRFNIASSPTKIFDSFGSGRPFVATDIPEVRCYADRIQIAGTPAEAAAFLRQSAASHSPELARETRDFAREHVWQKRAALFLKLLGNMDSASTETQPQREG